MKNTLTAQFATHTATKRTTVDYKFAAEVLQDGADPLVFWSQTQAGAAKLAARCVDQVLPDDRIGRSIRAMNRRTGAVVKVQD